MVLIPCLVSCTVLTVNYYVNNSHPGRSCNFISPFPPSVLSLETSQVIFRPTAALVKVRVVHKCAEKYFKALSLINAALQTSCFICRVTLMVT